MKKLLFSKQKNFLLTLIAGIILIGILVALPTGFEDAVIYQGTQRAVCEVLEVNNSAVITSGLIQSGEQSCKLLVRTSKFRGTVIEGVNFLSGSLEKDKIFSPKDYALVTISCDGTQIKSVIMSDHFRLGQELILMLLFVVLLIVFAGKNGLQAILSFVITIMCIWKILVPSYLKGYSPVWMGIAIVTLLTIVIIFFVYGIDKRSLTAILGALLGVMTTCLLGILFTDLFHIHGAIMSNAESLLYSGYEHLDLTSIFMSSIFIGASGAMMDLSVDITSAVWEIVQKKPEIGRWEAFQSGITIGRAAMGTMTTTLLLAYSGSYVTLMMVFMAQGTPIDHILNYKYISSEILHTIAGSFGLVTVAPFTALVAAFMFAKAHTES
ncbi:MAG: YibE/F family protein [Clostridia bacterium]|nr:YibE/F family protein [Clostridia bacterium]